MKTIKLLLIIVLTSYSIIIIAQDVMNPYINLTNIDLNFSPNEVTIFPPSWASQSPPYYTWANKGLVSGYSGEYEINLAWHPWNTYFSQGIGFGLHISYGMEIVSFPFTPDCVFSPLGCSGLASSTERNLYMPSDPYDSNTDSWGGLSNKFYQPRLQNTTDQTLASQAFGESVPLFYGQNDKILPHTVIKHTVYVHCGPLTYSPPYPDIEYSFSWTYDNTRGRMRYYPFCTCNSCPSLCTENKAMSS